MAEDIPVSTEQQQEAQPAIPVELAQMMELSLNGGQPSAPVTPDTPIVTDPQAATTQDPLTPPASTDPFAIFKEKYGFQAPEDVIKEIDELRVFKANPTPAEIKFENETSEKLFRALQKGERSEVYKVLAQQEKLESLTTAEVNNENAESIIKMAISLKNSDLTPQEIDFQYKQDYTLPKPPKEPVQKATETDEEFDDRKAEYNESLTEYNERVSNIEMKRSIAAKMAKPELEAAKSKIVLPEFDEDIDEGYVQYLKTLEARPAIEAEIQAEYNAFTPKTIEAKIPFIDEANKINFEFQYEPDGESFNKAVEMAKDINKFFNEFKTADGKPDRKGFLEALYFGLNRNKVITEAIKQSKNATIKASLPDNSSGPQRQFPQHQELSELDRMMQASLNGYARR